MGGKLAGITNQTDKTTATANAKKATCCRADERKYPMFMDTGKSHLVTAQQHNVLLNAYCGVLQTMQAATWARLIPSPALQWCQCMLPSLQAHSLHSRAPMTPHNYTLRSVKQHKCWSLATC
jgi:hypothetical protein